MPTMDEAMREAYEAGRKSQMMGLTPEQRKAHVLYGNAPGISGQDAEYPGVLGAAPSIPSRGMDAVVAAYEAGKASVERMEEGARKSLFPMQQEPVTWKERPSTWSEGLRAMGNDALSNMDEVLRSAYEAGRKATQAGGSALGNMEEGARKALFDPQYEPATWRERPSTWSEGLKERGGQLGDAAVGAAGRAADMARSGAGAAKETLSDADAVLRDLLLSDTTERGPHPSLQLQKRPMKWGEFGKEVVAPAVEQGMQSGVDAAKRGIGAARSGVDQVMDSLLGIKERLPAMPEVSLESLSGMVQQAGKDLESFKDVRSLLTDEDKARIRKFLDENPNLPPSISSAVEYVIQ